MLRKRKPSHMRDQQLLGWGRDEWQMLFILICGSLNVLAFSIVFFGAEKKNMVYITLEYILKFCFFFSLADGCLLVNQWVLLLLHVWQHLRMITWLLIWMRSCQTLFGPQGQNQVWQETYWKVSFQDASISYVHCLLKARTSHKKRTLVYGNRRFLIFWLVSQFL